MMTQETTESSSNISNTNSTAKLAFKTNSKMLSLSFTLHSPKSENTGSGSSITTVVSLGNSEVYGLFGRFVK
jgi:hypothetical protein